VLRPATPIPGIGECAIVADPEGAALAPFTYAAGATPADTTPAPGAFGWHELLTGDLAGAQRFYGEVFGLAASALEIPGLGPYWVFSGGGAPLAGALPMPPEATAPAQWLPYVLVEDVDATAARARALGAKPHAAPADVPGVGRYAVLDDPTGAMFAVFRTAAR
jgi:predicted enzyme related to lactoylglutathione lyase